MQDVAAQAGWGLERADALAVSKGRSEKYTHLRQGAMQHIYRVLKLSVPSYLLKTTVLVAGSVRHFPFPGQVQVQNGSKEAVVMHIYIKSAFRRGKVLLRGFMFAESAERDWYHCFVARITPFTHTACSLVGTASPSTLRWRHALQVQLPRRVCLSA